jgi:hypothetical protein
MGGKGSGRKPIGGEPLVHFSVRLPAEAAQAIKAIGKGNLSAGIRELYRKEQEGGKVCDV